MERSDTKRLLNEARVQERRNRELICETALIIAESARLVDESRKLLSPVRRDQH